MTTHTSDNLNASSERIALWLQAIQDQSEVIPDPQAARALRFAKVITASVLEAFNREREYGADNIGATAAVPVAMAHALVAIAAHINSSLSLMEAVQILGSETFLAAEQLAALAEDEVQAPITEN